MDTMTLQPQVQCPTSIDAELARCRELYKADDEFIKWLDSDYVPIAGGWQY